MDYNKPSSKNIANVKINEISCIGCRDGILNQLGHMELGGCLHDNYYNDTYNDNDTDEN